MAEAWPKKAPNEPLRATARRSICALLWVLAGVGMPVVAPSVHAQRLAVDVLTEDDGLPGSEVNSIVSAPDGRLWFATRIGIGIFDGVDWTSIGYGDGLPAPSVYELHVAKDGRVWGLTQSALGVVAYFDGQEWSGLPWWGEPQDFKPPSDMAILEIPSSGPPIPFLIGADGALMRRQGDGWRPDEILAASGTVAHEIEPAADGRSLWLAADKLYRVTETETLVAGRLPKGLEPPILGVVDDGTTLWLAGTDWLAEVPGTDRLDGGELRPQRVARGSVTGSAGAVPVQLSGDGYGGLVAVSKGGVRHWGAGETVARVWDRDAGLVENVAGDVALDADGNLWIASVHGVSRIRSLATQGWDRRQLFSDEASSLLELNDGTVLIGHEGGLTWMGSTGVEKTLALQGPDGGKPRIMDLLEVPEGLWIAARQVGMLFLEDGKPDRLQWYVGDKDPGPYVSSLAGGDRGEVWVGSGAGVYQFESGRFVRDPAGPKQVRRFFRGADGRLAATVAGEGLWLREPDGRWHIVDGVSSFGGRPEAYTVWIDDADGEVWVGCTDGLYRLAQDRLEWVAGLELQRPVFALLRARDGDFWLGTDNGVYRWDEQAVRRFGISDGQMGRESNRDALLQDRQGRIWLGTNRGLTSFDPARIRPLPEPRIELGPISLVGRSLQASRDIRLPHDQASPVFTVHATTFADPKRLEVQGRLAGFEETFENLGTGRHDIRFTQLAPGKYRYEVRYRWQGMDWRPGVASGELIVSEPWWRSPAFFVGAFFAVLTFFGLMVWATSNYRYSRKLADRVAERTADLEHLARRLQAEIEEHKRTETDLRVATSAAEQASRAKSSFLATMSHEIRTPMNGILGIAYLLEREELSAGQQQRVATLRRSGEALLEILDDILDYSKIEAGALELSPHPFDLPLLLEEVATLFEPRASEKGIELRRRFAEELPRWVVGDSSRVRQVLINLIGNAVKFTDEGSVTIEALHRPERRLNVALRVQDSGIGIAEESQWQLFQPFHQLDSGHHRRHGGTGLGLAISHHLVTAMEGRIRVDSELGQGATFIVELSLPDAPDQTTATLNLPYVGPDVADRLPMRILLAEDNPINRMIALDMLAELGYQDVREAENGLEALQALGEESFDIILMDLQMPELGGLETARRVVEMFGEARPRMIALTAHAFHSDREACLDAGMDDHLPKPLSIEMLAEALELWAPRRGPLGNAGVGPG